ncbi:MAG: glycosyltransferase family 4 protein [Sulfuricaulis sp.]
MRLAYLVNQHPMPSTTFVRREMAVLEAIGHKVDRYTVRRLKRLIDPLDLAEEKRTRAILDVGMPRLFAAMLGVVIRRPVKFIEALRLAIHTGRKSDRSTLHHLIYLAEACVLLNWLAESRPDHLHVHFGTNSAMVAMLCRVLGGPPYSVTVHGPEEFDRATVLALDEKISRSAFMIAISDFGRSQLMRWCDSRHWAKIHVVRCGLDSGFLRQPFKPISSTMQLVCVGRLSEQKGQLLLVEAAARLRDEGRKFELLLVGDGEMRPQIEQAVTRQDLNGLVTLTGAATGEQVRQHMLASRALVLPSLAEGLPVVIMEALALGRPVVTTYVGGIPELVKEGVSGWLVTPGAVEPLVTAMREVLDAPPQKLEAMGQAGARRVHEQHDIESIAAQLSGLMHNAATGKVPKQ